MDKQLHFKRALCGRVVLPASKSISNRVLVVGALAHGNYHIGNLSEAADTCVLVDALRAAAGTADAPTIVDIGPEQK